MTSLGRLCRKQVAFEIEFWIFRTYLTILGYPGSMEFLWLIGAHFHWKLSSKKTLLHKPDMYSYGEQSSLRVNTSYTEDHESSAIDAGLLLWPITGKRSNEPWNWFVKTSIPGALSPVLENFCRSFSRPNCPWVCEDGIYPDFLKRYLQIDLFFLKKNQSINHLF